MKRILLSLALVSGLVVSRSASGLRPRPRPKTMSQSLGLVVFPAKGQTADVQKTDEGACYDWAKQQTGYDPVAPPPAPTAAPVQAQKGGAVKGAAEGCRGRRRDRRGRRATRATAPRSARRPGAIKGRRGQKQQTAAAQQQSQQQAASAGQAQKDGYKKAFGACMEGKGYTVK